MSFDWHAHAAEHYGNLPHPDAPGLKVKDFPTAVRLASLSKWGGHASAQEAEMFWKEFQGTGMSPEQYEKTVKQLASVSFSYHGRPPTMQEIVALKDKAPSDAAKYFKDLPDKHYPHVSAGDMVKYLHMAEPHAQEHIGRSPVKHEAAMHVTAGHSPQDVAEYYRGIARSKEGAGNESQNDQG